MLTSGFLSVLSQSFPVDETPMEGIYDDWVPFGEALFRQMTGSERALSSKYYTKAASIRMACPEFFRYQHKVVNSD